MSGFHSWTGAGASRDSRLLPRRSPVLRITLLLALATLLLGCAGAEGAAEGDGEGPAAAEDATAAESAAGGDQTEQDVAQAEGEGAAGSCGEWPTDPITIVVPAAAGAGTDRLARGLAPFLSEDLGVPVRVENRPGGGFTIGLNHVLNAEPDANTILLYAEPYFTAGRLNVPSDLDEWQYLGGLNSDPDVIMAPTDSYADAHEFFDALEAGGRSVVGIVTFSPGTPALLEAVEELGYDPPETVNYEDVSELRLDLIGSHVDAASVNYSSWVDLAEDGETRILAFHSAERHPDWPEVPTVREVVEERGGDSENVPLVSSVRMLATSAAVAESCPERVERLQEAVANMATQEGFLDWVAQNEAFSIEHIAPEQLHESALQYEQIINDYPELFGR